MKQTIRTGIQLFASKCSSLVCPVQPQFMSISNTLWLRYQFFSFVPVLKYITIINVQEVIL